jgi:hypothetical protein
MHLPRFSERLLDHSDVRREKLLFLTRVRHAVARMTVIQLQIAVRLDRPLLRVHLQTLFASQRD